MLKMLSITVDKQSVKLWTALLIGSAENCPISFPVRLLIQKLFWASDGFQIASWVAPQTWYLHSIRIWRVIRWSLFLFKHLRTVLIEEFFWDTCNMRAEPHASCWICRSVWQQSVALFSELWEQKLINNMNYCW